VGVTSTHYAGWVDNSDGELEPVYFKDPSSKKLITEYKSDYTVYLGRRYRGVPIIGPTLGVRLDPNGEMVAFMKGWRDISGETAPTKIFDSADATDKSKLSTDNELNFKGMMCGFTEGTAPAQSAAGIGCKLTYENPAAAGTLASEKVEWVNLAQDVSISLGIELDKANLDDKSAEEEQKGEMKQSTSPDDDN